MLPLVSVIMPTYNRHEYVIEAIKSIINQDYDNFELHIVDDGSTDNTQKLLQPFLSEKIHYHYQANQGQSVARNNGIRHAKGKYISFLDSDNLHYPDKISKQVEFLENNYDYDIVYGDNNTIDDKGEIISTKNMKRYSGYIYEKLLLNNFISNNTVMVRRECFDEMGLFNEENRLDEDYELWLKFSTKYKFYYMPHVFGMYRVMENQISSDKDRRLESNEKTIRASMNANRDLIDESMRKYVLCRFYTSKGAYKASVGNITAAIGDYLKALRYKLFCKYPWRAMARAILLHR